jgi:hypothetical protein
MGVNPTGHGGCEGVVERWVSRVSPNDFRMLEGVLRELGGEIDARQILDLVARGEFVVRALMDSTPFRTFENGGQKYMLQGEEIR